MCKKKFNTIFAHFLKKKNAKIFAHIFTQFLHTILHKFCTVFTTAHFSNFFAPQTTWRVRYGEFSEFVQGKKKYIYPLCIYLSGLKTHRYLSHPIAIMAREDKNTGIFWTAITKLHKCSVSGPKGHCWSNISHKLKGK